MSDRICRILLCLLLMALLPVQTLAAGNIDPERPVSLTLSFQDDGVPLTGAQFDAFLVATVDVRGELTATADFAQFNVNIRGENDDAWRALASTLEGYILLNQIAPTDSGLTDENGQLRFPCEAGSLPLGLYLVMGRRHVQDGNAYETEPFMVHLPGRDAQQNAWVYDVEAKVKFVSVPEADETPVGLRVIKVWKDNGYTQRRPQEIVIRLLQDGEVYESVTLSQENNWRHEWETLEAGHEWTVVEEPVADYSVEVVQEGVTFVVTNTYERETPPGEPSLPQTGQLWWPVPVLTAGGLLLIVLGLLRRRGAEDEK